jgi:hypothetical protein
MPKISVWASPPQLTAYTASPRPDTEKLEYQICYI